MWYDGEKQERVKHMREWLREIVHTLEAGEPVELVAVTEASGSTPRGAGALMAVFPGGRALGTIGGGNVEYEAQRLAAELLARGGSESRRFRFVQGDAASLGMVCGGDVTVRFQHLPAGDVPVTAVLRDLMEASAGDLDTWLVLNTEQDEAVLGTADRNGPRHLETPPEDLPALLQNQPARSGGWLAVPVVRAGRVYIFGGGHVSRALVPVIAAVGFRPVVYDDRPEFADPALFPQAEKVLSGDFTKIGERITLTADDYVVIMTRGHQADYEVLEQTLRSGVKYLGCIGSRRKLALCRERLLAAGFTAEEYGAVHAPIGLSIGAETPEEIAVSVAAELIAVRAGMQASGKRE